MCVKRKQVSEEDAFAEFVAFSGLKVMVRETDVKKKQQKKPHTQLKKCNTQLKKKCETEETYRGGRFMCQTTILIHHCAHW